MGTERNYAASPRDTQMTVKNSSKHYDRKRLVALLLDPTLDLRATAIRIAQEQPSVFIRLAITATTDTDEKMRRVCDFLRADPKNKYIEAIKLHRELFGSTLADAVNAIRPIRDKMLGAAP